MVIKGVIFDMDDTLYLERDYVKSGFRTVARHVSGVTEEENVFDAMWDMFEAGIRGDTFDRLLVKFPVIARCYSIKTLVEVYRSHAPDIEIMPEMRTLIHSLLKQDIALGVLSDGPLVSQQAKADALGVADLVEHVILTDALGREHWKPSPAGFELLAERMEIPHNSLVYVGDNPVKDFIAPRQLGWKAIRLRLPGQLRENEEPLDDASAPHDEVQSISQLYAALGVGELKDA